jgi:ribosome biogenesis GTPase A
MADGNEDYYDDDDSDMPDLDGVEIDLSSLLLRMEGGADVDISNTLMQSISKVARVKAEADAAEAPMLEAAMAMRADKVFGEGDGDLINDLVLDSSHLRKMKYAKFGKAKDGTVGKVSGGLATPASEICICQRCFRLEQYGQVEESLRPGWSEHELITPERFEKLLKVIRESKGVVLCFVDIFDLEGSILRNLRQIAGDNPVVIAANKVDLLPKDTNAARLKEWIHTDVKELCGFVNPKEAFEERRRALTKHGFTNKADGAGMLPQSNVHLVSCQNGHGIDSLMEHVVTTSRDNGDTVFVMGAANVGKSSFVNRLLAGDVSYGKSKGGGKKKRDKNIARATVSNLPGTTLNFLKMQLPNGVTVIDTPGLINQGQLTSKLSPEELRQVIPSKPIKPVTLRVQEGGCVLVGGLAMVELVEGRPFFLTFFVSNEVKLHPTRIEKAQEFVEKHVGDLVAPPATVERLHELGPFQEDTFIVDGEGWKKSGTDVVIAGLGWVSVTGSGSCTILVRTPQGTKVDVRPAFMPFEATRSTASFSGGRLVQKKGKKSRGC